MAKRSYTIKVRSPRPVVSQSKTCPRTNGKAERSKTVEAGPQLKSASGPAKRPTDNLFAKEEQYKILNAELEAKTAEIVREAEQLMSEQGETLSRPLSSLLLTDIEDEEDARIMKSHRGAVQDPSRKVVNKKKVTSISKNTGIQQERPDKTQNPHMVNLLTMERSADPFLDHTIRGAEEKTNGSAMQENIVHVFPVEDNVGSGILDAQVRIVTAKLRIMQGELDQLSSDYYEKEHESAKLCAQMKDLEEERARLQKTTSIQRTQIEKHRALADEAGKKCDGLQLQVSSLHKEIEALTRAHKQAAAVHSTVEVRLNRALEEGERLKAQLDKMKQVNKDKITEEHHSKESLLAENHMLKKQKSELIVGFKKQLKLIDILKRQKMHFEAARLLSFTEEEFMKALDWGKS
ncbi:testis-expressed protein 9 [Brachionichthys hirsutus]|uniref:testis-expressed protein 9 n=1 Tax=Brachionichthys hirsutus TaxID=412623 RepID=UPI00360480F2